MNTTILRAPASSAGSRLLPVGAFLVLLGLWTVLARAHLWPESVFPSPAAVARGGLEELRSGRLSNDVMASLWRVSIGFLLAAAMGVPFGLWLGHHCRARAALLPMVNFFRNLSPLAWITFAILWFGIGDAPAVFLIFLASFFPLALAVSAAVASIPDVYFQVARDYGLQRGALLTRVTLPAIMPELITALRVTAGVAWMVVVAAEMIAGLHGLGFAIWDDRNGLRTDLLIVHMGVIGLVGVGLDQVMLRMTRIPAVRWAYER